MESSPESQETAPTNKDGDMRRTALWVVGLCVASAGVVFALRAQERQIAKAPAAAAAPAAPAPSKTPEQPPQGKTVHTFTDQTEMEQFAQVWRQRQAALARSAVLESYMTQEQQMLKQMNEELLSKYSLDVAKAYTLDAEHKTLIEHEGPPPGQEAASAAGQPPVPPAATPKP